MKIISLVAPIYLIVFLGWWLRRKELYTDEVDKFISFITYRIMLPISIFTKVSTANISIGRDTVLFYGILFALMIIFLTLYRVTQNKKHFECFVNTVRGNSIYLGFPVMMQLLPANILPLGLVLASALSPLAILGIEVLYKLDNRNNMAALKKKPLIQNPLIQALLFGMLFNVLNCWHPFLDQLTSAITKPVMFLSLLLVGANFRLQELRSSKQDKELYVVLFNKLLIVPILFYIASQLLDLSSAYTAIGIILFSTPGAVSNLVMLKQLGRDSELTVHTTLIGTALYLAILPLIGYLVQTVL